MLGTLFRLKFEWSSFRSSKVKRVVWGKRSRKANIFSGFCFG